MPKPVNIDLNQTVASMTGGRSGGDVAPAAPETRFAGELADDAVFGASGLQPPTDDAPRQGPADEADDHEQAPTTDADDEHDADGEADDEQSGRPSRSSAEERIKGFQRLLNERDQKLRAMEEQLSQVQQTQSQAQYQQALSQQQAIWQNEDAEFHQAIAFGERALTQMQLAPEQRDAVAQQIAANRRELEARNVYRKGLLMQAQAQYQYQQLQQQQIPLQRMQEAQKWSAQGVQLPLEEAPFKSARDSQEFNAAVAAYNLGRQHAATRQRDQRVERELQQQTEQPRMPARGSQGDPLRGKTGRELLNAHYRQSAQRARR